MSEKMRPEAILAEAEAAQQQFEKVEKERVDELKSRREKKISEEKNLSESAVKTKDAARKGRAMAEGRKTDGKRLAPEVDLALNKLEAAAAEEDVAVESAVKGIKEIEDEPGVMEAVEDEARKENIKVDSERKRKGEELEKAKECEQALQEAKKALQDAKQEERELVYFLGENGEWALSWHADFKGSRKGYSAEISPLKEKFEEIGRTLKSREADLEKIKRTFLKIGRGKTERDIQKLKTESDKVDKIIFNVETRRKDVESKVRGMMESFSEKVTAFRKAQTHYENLLPWDKKVSRVSEEAGREYDRRQDENYAGRDDENTRYSIEYGRQNNYRGKHVQYKIDEHRKKHHLTSVHEEFPYLEDNNKGYYVNDYKKLMDVY